MIPTTHVRALAVGTLLLVALPVPACAQAELWLSPILGKDMVRADYRTTYYFDERVKEQPTDLGLTQHRLSLSVPVWRSPRDEWSVSASVRRQDFETDAILPDTGERFPEELWDVRIGAPTAIGSTTAGSAGRTSQSGRPAMNPSPARTRSSSAAPRSYACLTASVTPGFSR
jgi:hypothetical protein